MSLAIHNLPTQLLTSSVKSSSPQLGLVCITHGKQVRFRIITRTRYLQQAKPQRAVCLRELYADNLNRLFSALAFCDAHDIRLYRLTSALFPQIDDPTARKVLDSMKQQLAAFGHLARALNIRAVLHPDQFVVLNSESESVVKQSIAIMADHAHIFDLLDLPRSPWAAMIVHGGKAGRADQLIEVIQQLPENIRNRLVLENDERAYSTAEILDICKRANVPMVFDAHHHVIREQLDSYEHPSVKKMTQAARATWPDPQWQMVHISNGREFFADPRHSDLITQVPTAFNQVQWVEVEAKHKEIAIEQLRRSWRGGR